MAEHWALLGIAPTDDKREVKRAYTRILKQIDVDADPAAFVRLREALDAALEWGTATPWWEAEEEFVEEAEPEGPTQEAADIEDPDEFADLDEFGGYQSWRATLPPLGEGDLARRCTELDAMLFADEPPDPAAVEALGRAILADPELANVDRAAAVEQWLAETIPAAAPAADPLLEPGLRRFGWDKAQADWRRSGFVEGVLQRRQDLAFLGRAAKEGQVHNRALAELSGPARTRLPLHRLGVAGEVSRFLQEIRQDHPTAERNLNPEAVEWWRDYLHKRHLPAAFWLLMALIPAVLAFLAAILAANAKVEVSILFLWLAAVPATLGGILFYAETGARGRRRAEQRWEGEFLAPPFWPLGGALLLPLAAALVPPAPLTAVLVGVLALGLGGAAVIQHWLPRDDYGLRPNVPWLMPGATFLLSCAILIEVGSERSLVLALPLLLAPVVAHICYRGIWDRLTEAPFDRQRQAIIGATPLLAVSAAVLCAAAAGWLPPAFFITLLPVSVLCAWLLTAAAEGGAARVEWPTRLAALVLYFSASAMLPNAGVDPMPLAIGAYLLALSTLNIAFAFREAVARPAADT